MSCFRLFTVLILTAQGFCLADEGLHFDQVLAPLIAQRCLSCHGESDPKGGLNLSEKKAMLSGGESGAVVIPGQPDQSLLWQYIESDMMPPKKPLTAPEKDILRQWISDGAVWGTDRIDPFRFSTEERAGIDWWSLQPISTVSPPQARSIDASPHPIDRFLEQSLQANGLALSEEADRRTLIRRLSFDLLGLPPTTDDVQQFVNATSEDAWPKLVDQYLQSPHYGERWARHWLDIVRFGESNGFEYDEPRDNFWHYRDWVIQALNQDLPYDQFVRLQLAGDVLHPQDRHAVAASGFLVAGPHNTTLPANDAMRKSMAQDELEELAGTVGQTFLGLTVNCARCHDHKFDPISQKDYYSFAAAFMGVTHGERKVHVPLTDSQRQRLAAIDDEIPMAGEKRSALEEPARSTILSERGIDNRSRVTVPTPLLHWEFGDGLQEISASIGAELKGAARIDQGALILDGKDSFVATTPIPIEITEKTLEAWVQLDRLDQSGGAVISLQAPDGTAFDAIVFAEREPAMWMAGSDGFVRTHPFHGEPETDAAERFVHLAIVYRSDGTVTGYRDGVPYGRPYQSPGLQTFLAGKSQLLFGLRHSPPGGNRLLAGRISRALLYDRALSAVEVLASARSRDRTFVSREQLLAKLSPDDRSQYQQLTDRLTALKEEHSAIVTSETQVIYASLSTPPAVARILERGEVTSPGQEVSPAGLPAVTAVDSDFGLPVSATDAERRVQMADWVTDGRNALFARVMVNRLWHYHFGQGLVTTPNDFGFNGGRPSHPELLEWLAAEFQRSGYSLKAMHRLILTSAAWRQASTLKPEAMTVDADNRLLWRKSPVRLEAEVIRDAALFVSGTLNSEVGGRGYRDVEHYKYRGSNFYRSLEEAQAASFRRTVYRFSPRGGRNSLLDTFDCPDPSSTAPKRAATVTPLQSLSLMNNSLVFRLSDALADRVREHSKDSSERQIADVYQRVFSRDPTEPEIQQAVAFTVRHGLSAFCRIALNSNEFLYVQ
jgi:hypothetical protein